VECAARVSRAVLVLCCCVGTVLLWSCGGAEQELHQLVLDMSVLVEQQGEVLDQVEVHVGAAHEEVKGAGVQLVKAEQTRRNTRKWVCVGVLAVLIILLVISSPHHPSDAQVTWT